MQKGFRYGWVLGTAIAAALAMTACDDNGKTSTADMSATPDMTAAAGTPGQGQLIVADVGGSLPSPIAGMPDVMHAHQVIVLPSFPAVAPTPDYSTLVFSPGASTGCSVTRYDLGAGKAPAPNLDAGKITISGLNPATQIVSTLSFTALPTHPTSITCTNTAGSYTCLWGEDNSDGGADELTSLNVANSFFPDLSGEQHPFSTNVDTNIFMTLEGSKLDGGTGGFGPFATSIGGGSDPLGTATITGIMLGSTNMGTAIEALSGHIDGSQPITFTYSCDGSATTGSGCPAPGTAPLDTVALLAQTSQLSRGRFAQPPTETKFGIGQCLDQSNDPAHQVIFDTNALAALLTTSTGADGGVLQVGGSSLFAIVRIKAKINVASTATPEVFAAGRGTLGIVDLP